MAIVQPRVPPADGPGLVGKALRDLGAHPNLAKSALAGGAPLNLSQPLPVYRLGLNDISDERSIDKATEAGWRYLIEHTDSGGAGYADVKTATSGELKFTSLSKNANADRLMEAAHLAQKIGQESPVNYEARILDVPSAIWLAAPTPVFIPYIDPANLAKPDAAVQVQPDFLKNLVRLAAEARSHLNDGPLQGGR